MKARDSSLRPLLGAAAALALLGLLLSGCERPGDWPGAAAPAAPLQVAGPLPEPWRSSGGFLIRPLASYRITAVVLASKRYRGGEREELSPVDLALGWGPMSQAAVLNRLSFSQSNRWYFYRWQDEPPLAPEAIAAHSANTHLLPADDAVRRVILAVRRHERVTLSGYLVEVEGDDGFRWRSSLSRGDTGSGSCEVFWVVRAESGLIPH